MPAQTRIRPLPPEVRARLEKLMLVLGSSSAGERASAAGMITALLREHGRDWHDLVGAIGQPMPPPPPAAKPRYSRVNPRSMSEAELQRLVRLIMRSPLNIRARRFLAGLQDRASFYGEISFSDRQWVWFLDLANRAGAL